MRALVMLTASMFLVAIAVGGEKKQPELPYKNDPKIMKLLEGLGDNSSLGLPARNKHGDGPYTRDYTMRMAYAPERQTAMYAGGNHNNGRRNDCWEYHLGSNTWHCLFKPVGGDHYFMKAFLYWRMPEIRKARAKNPKYQPTGKLKDYQEKVRKWWLANVVIQDGHIVTKGGGPIMPSHTWDGLSYDPLLKRMLWSAGAHNGRVSSHSYFTGIPVSEIRKKMDRTYKSMWTFDPWQKKWIRYRTKNPTPDFRGMGQSLVYVPDIKKTIWYVAAANVVPHSYQMWTYDSAADKWQQLKPNGGKSIRGLVHKLKVAPAGEQIMRYSTKDKMVVAIQGEHTYTYDPAKNVWARICSDKRIYGHDAKSILVYDSVNDVFLYSYPKGTPKGKLKFAKFDLKTRKWEEIRPKGPGLHKTTWGAFKGYFDPAHNVFVIHGGNWRRTWVYRYKRAEKKSGK
jgi:hypothetical protein